MSGERERVFLTDGQRMFVRALVMSLTGQQMDFGKETFIRTIEHVVLTGAPLFVSW
jgi:hypothetical protein